MSEQQAASQATREQMRYWASGVGIVATVLDGQAHGMTISSFTSLSLEPPRILVSLYMKTRTYELVQASQSFAVTLLSSEQQEISRKFAGQVADDGNRFDGIDWQPSLSGNPIISGGLAYFDCKVVESFVQGEQTVFVAEVLDAGAPEDKPESAKPLLYYFRDYRQMGD